MQRLRNILYNSSFAFNCMLLFLLVFESRIVLPGWVQTIGRMHTLLLHFPIVLLLLAVCWEVFLSSKKLVSQDHVDIGNGLLLFTAFTSSLSALMGLLLSREDGYTQELVVWHKWGGAAVSLLSLLWYAYRNRIRRIKLVSTGFAVLLTLSIVVTGHLGGDITHGDNFLLAPVSKEKAQPAVLLEDAVVFTDMVQPILKSKCTGCHNERKAKGELVLENYAALLKGGKSGALWDPAKSDFGLLLGRVHLPLDNKKHMPPSGKPQLTAAEESILYQWIKSGAGATVKVAALSETDTLKLLAAALFNTIETDEYSFEAADEAKIKALKNNYRLVSPLAEGSPALGVTFFSAAQFKPDQLKELLPVKEQVITLNLNKMPVTDEDLTVIAQFVHLRKLNLSFTGIKGGNLATLNVLKELKQLSLSGTGVNAASLAALASLPKLTELHIWNTPAQTEDVAALQQKLKHTQVHTGFKGDTIVIKLNNPFIENEEQIVLEPVQLQLKHFVKGAEIRFTTDGSEPDSIAAPVFNGDFKVDRSMTVRAKAYKPGWISSDVTEYTFFKSGYPVDSIRLLHPPQDEFYKSISATVLTDNKKGEKDFRSGKWIGYRGTAMQALMFFNSPKKISSVTVSNLVDIGSFIMPPQQVEVWAGNDEKHLRLIKKINPVQPVKEAPAFMKGFELSFEPVTEKVIKIVVVPVAKLPTWHRGKGDKGWIFVDEIFLN